MALAKLGHRGREPDAALLAAHVADEQQPHSGGEPIRACRVSPLEVEGALVEHPAVIEAAEGVLGPHIHLSIGLAIQIYPGEAGQVLHHDDGLFPVAWPHQHRPWAKVT